MVGRHFPASAIGLTTRLESTSEEMLHELKKHPKLDCIIHLAAMTLVADCQKNPEQARQMNVEGAVKWFEAAAQAGVKHFIFASTSHVYGDPHTQDALSTDWPVNPVSVYGKTKVEAEAQLLILAKKYPNTKLTIARMFSLLSENSNPGLLYSNLIRRAREKDFSPVPGLNYVRDFLFVEEAVKRLLRVCSWADAPTIVHICSGQARTILSLAQEVFARFDLDAKKLLTTADPKPGDITWLVGQPTQIPS